MTDDARARTSSGTSRDEYLIRVFDDPADIDSAVWDGLVAAQPSATPFVSMAYLRALHESASAVAATGWAPHFLAIERGGETVAACPLYLKDHSYGEYVFDWAWADAYQRHGLDYYPKLLDAVPFTPVPGRACWHERRSTGSSWCVRSSSWRGRPSCHRRICSSSTRTTRRRRARRAGRCAPPSSSTGATARRAVRRLRRLPGQPAARQAQEDPAGAAPRRRRGRRLHGRDRRRDRRRPTGTSSIAATPSRIARITRRRT
jgi:hypothetical protein